MYRKLPGEYNEVEGIFPDGRYTLVESSRDQREHNSNYIDKSARSKDPAGVGYGIFVLTLK